MYIVYIAHSNLLYCGFSQKIYESHICINKAQTGDILYFWNGNGCNKYGFKAKNVLELTADLI